MNKHLSTNFRMGMGSQDHQQMRTLRSSWQLCGGMERKAARVGREKGVESIRIWRNHVEDTRGLRRGAKPAANDPHIGFTVSAVIAGRAVILRTSEFWVAGMRMYTLASDYC